MTGYILDLCKWLKSNGCTHVAMENTGLFWPPIYNILELEDFDMLVVNAQHIRAALDVKPTATMLSGLRISSGTGF